MTSQPLIDFERAMYCERGAPDCGACTLAHDGLDCLGVAMGVGSAVDSDQPARDRAIAAAAWRGRHERRG